MSALWLIPTFIVGSWVGFALCAIIVAGKRADEVER
jgi:hypothetical protein